MKAYASSHGQSKPCPACHSAERVLVGGSAKCDVMRCSECGYVVHVVDYHVFSLGENCERLEHFPIKAKGEFC